MLSLLHIENIAVIECADISFDKGFNILTGETGAGKSIVIDAISAMGNECHIKFILFVVLAIKNATGTSTMS